MVDLCYTVEGTDPPAQKNAIFTVEGGNLPKIAHRN